jgi:hypothetical protein
MTKKLRDPRQTGKQRQERKASAPLRRVERAVAAYYDNLSAEDMEADAMWGEFALRQMASCRRA